MNGNAHAFGSSEPKPSLWTLANPDILFKPFGDGRFNFLPGGFAVRQGDPDFLTFPNPWIQISTSSGWLPAREKYWFQTDGWFGEIEDNPFAKKN